MRAGTRMPALYEYFNQVFLHLYTNQIMKKYLLICVCACSLSACSIFRNNKTGCPTNGKNIGAERILSGDKKANKAARKAKKFKS